eukprot:TRINITY_DN19516_c0_g3_i1.p1 TRINITY_DN19516_c0_g3~~TRINITY_DN19516_c0_g3_i1.p1  ORF type:complete len:187 (-),score=6.03 TRINITY_DN19516_c0_g3_i1:245-805(-)
MSHPDRRTRREGLRINSGISQVQAWCGVLEGDQGKLFPGSHCFAAVYLKNNAAKVATVEMTARRDGSINLRCFLWREDRLGKDYFHEGMSIVPMIDETVVYESFKLSKGQILKMSLNSLLNTFQDYTEDSGERYDVASNNCQHFLEFILYQFGIDWMGPDSMKAALLNAYNTVTGAFNSSTHASAA